MLRLFFSAYLFLLFFVLFGVDYIADAVMSGHERELAKDVAKDYQGVFLLLEELYPRLSKAEWQQMLEKITRQSNTPIENRTLGNWHLNAPAAVLVETGQPFVGSHEDDIVYKKISDDVVVRIGPMDTSASVERIDDYFEPVLLLVLGIVTLLWASWQQYKIKRLANTTQRFSEGYLESRAPLGFVGIPGLSAAFNTMAERIQRLFFSHKHLTNAVSHELRSPITRIRFQLELLDDSHSKRERDRVLKALAENLDDMDLLVDEMLSYARMERADLPMHIEEIELRHWLRQQQQHLRGEVTTPITLALPDQPLAAQFDSLLLARLLRNLVTNASRYANTRIEIGVTQHTAELHLWVDDDGPGIPERQRSRLFEPFVRLDESRNRDTGGHGLGLAIAAQIARCHSGRMEVETSPLGGVRLLFVWPLVINATQASMASNLGTLNNT